MPYKRNYRRKRNFRKKPSIYGTKARFIPRGLATKRYGQVSTKTFYFKASGTIDSDTGTGITQQLWGTQSQPALPGIGLPRRMPNVADAYTFALCYTEYKVLAVKVRIFAANVGSEPGAMPAASGTPGFVAGFNRGDTVVYLDQDIRPGEVMKTDILDVMNLGSCKMVPSRVAKYTKVMYRKKGLPEWGCCDRNVLPINRVPDPWNAAIILLGNNARVAPNVAPLWFYTVTYKIIFRGRSFT